MLPVKLSLMSASPTQAHLDRCLWQRHQGAACKYCLDACPSGALQFHRRTVDLNPDRCLGCGVCLVACPVECFETEDWSERSLIDTLGRLKQPAVEVACKLHPAPHLGDEAVPVLQVNACLAAVSPGLWFEMGLEHSVQVRLDACPACPLSNLAHYAQQAVELANTWLESCGRQRNLALQDTNPEQLPANRRVVVSAERPILSRRDFLFAFARGSGPAEKALACLPGHLAEHPDDKIPPHQPAWLRRLAAVYSGLVTPPCTESGLEASTPSAEEAAGESRPPEPAGALWPTLSIADHCAACGACARYCPSGALSTTVVDGLFQHVFIPGVCVACGLCAQVCRSGALIRDYTMEPDPFSPRVMAARQTNACRRCGSPALAELDGLCYWCAKEPPMRSLLDDARGFLLSK